MNTTTEKIFRDQFFLEEGKLIASNKWSLLMAIYKDRHYFLLTDSGSFVHSQESEPGGIGPKLRLFCLELSQFLINYMKRISDSQL
jgi:hypothetical protein